VLDTAAAAVSGKPAFSPFERDQNRRRFDEKAVVVAPIVAAVRPIAVPMPVPVEVSTPAPMPVPAEMVLTEGDVMGAALVEVGNLAEAADPMIALTEGLTEQAARPVPFPSAEALQGAAVDALSAAKNQATAADALADAEWTVKDGEVRVQTDLSKTMLPMVINGEAEKLVKNALRDAGTGALKLVLLPGVKTAASPKKPRAAKSGSAQAKAMDHPIVQRAQTLFNAEIRTVIDLREND
jgi:DNA polymerase-3 subunit gamma/tau